MCTKFINIILTLTLLFVCEAIQAQNNTMTFQTTVTDFIETLAPSGLEIKGPAMIAPDNLPEDYTTLIEQPTARSLVLFDFDSALITEPSYHVLENLAIALQSELANATLVVIGHTDSTGDAKYNLDLSRFRAEAVKEALVFIYGIDASRLILRWYGEDYPLLPEQPFHPNNRRVEFVNVQP